ncbi:MAG: NAD(P)/FAD-dependent oxidoreductase [Candidatus Micrarchaeaceae archaeon]
MNIAIVGSGISGTTVAKRILDKTNANIDIYEMRSEPKAICGGGLGEYALQRIMNYDKEIYNIMMRSTKTVIKTAKLQISDGQKTAEYDMSADDLNIDRLGVVMDRHELDNTMLKTVVKMGANFIPKTKVNPEELVGKYSYVIDARGVDAWDRNTKDMVVAYQEYYPKSSDDLVLYLNTNMYKLGYAWSFPKGNEVKVGYGEDSKIVGNRNREYMKLTKDVFGISGEPTKVEGSPLPLNGDIKLKSGNVYRVGTAAGFIDPLTGGGIRMAVESGIQLAKTILKNEVWRYRFYSWKLETQIKLSLMIRNRLLNMSPDMQMKLLTFIQKNKPKDLDVYNYAKKVLLRFFA